MSNKEKAEAFLKVFDKNPLDSRCQMLIMMLTISTGMSIEDCLLNIRKLARE